MDVFFDALYHNTTSNFQIAPEPLDAATRAIVTSKDSIVWEYRHEVTTKPIPVPAPDDPVPALAIIPADPALVPLPGTPPATA